MEDRPLVHLRNYVAPLLLAVLVAPAAQAQSLDSRINALLGSTQLKGASVSLDIVEVTKNGPVSIFSHNGTTPLGPASNCKLLTTAAAFERYGPKAAFKTHLYRVGDDLVLVGGGDPALGDAKLAAEIGQKPTTAFEEWADRLRQPADGKPAVTTYRDLIVDDRVFDTQWVHPNWPADQRLDWYSAPVGGLNFNANCLDWIPQVGSRGVGVELIPNTSYVSVTIKATTGKQTQVSLLRPAESNRFEMRGTVASTAKSAYSVPIYDPGMWTGTVLRDVLARAGIRGTGQVRRAAAGEQFVGGQLLATHETPLLAVLRRANTNSLNMMAEGLCKRLGYDAAGGKQPGTWENGTRAVEAYAVSAGAKAEWVALDDGSGLSNKNRVAAKAFTTVLAHVAARPDGGLFVSTLAVPGEDGTLERRFRATKSGVADHVHAKTGHISGVSTLSGYVQLDGPGGKDRGRLFAFSILCNKYQGNVNPWQDQVCEALYQWANGK
jgi:D-alanyl-D-alanine carboxypeptidase/D-alanyl-D-alanine-endopeptidase (penicillin-binding protein 4)